MPDKIIINKEYATPPAYLQQLVQFSNNLCCGLGPDMTPKKGCDVTKLAIKRATS